MIKKIKITYADLKNGKKGQGIEKSREFIIIGALTAAAALCGLLCIIRLFESRMDMVLVSLFSFLISLLFVFLAKKGHSQGILLMASIAYTAVAFNEGYRLGIPIQTPIYFSFIPAVIVLLLNHNPTRIAFLILNLLAFLMLNYLVGTQEWTHVITFVLITILGHFIVLFFVDLMEKQQGRLVSALEGQKKANDALEVKHDETLLFNNMMSHDVKAPLRTIKGFTSLLQSKTQLSEEQSTYINFISGSTQNLENLIGDLLTLSKINTIQKDSSPIEFNGLINQICQSFSYDITRKKIQFQIDEVPSIFGNRETIGTVFQNIISNAIKYQPKEENHIPIIKISYKEDKDFNILYFQDNGIGLEEKNIAKLFEPFVRFHNSKQYEGTGLGMTICKRIMEQHRGTIRYFPNSEPGTCFELKFPKKK